MFIENPNLPKGRVTLVAVSSLYPSILSQIIHMGIRVIPIVPYSHLERPIQSHGDMVLHHMGGSKLFLAKHQDDLFLALKNFGFSPEYIEEDIAPSYPADVALNSLRIGEKLFCNQLFTSKKILQKGIVHPVKQGYSKCSVAVVSEHAVITGDEGMAKAMKASGVEVLKIQSEKIILDGYDNGFIGGCCGKISGEMLLFTGDISSLPDYKAIKEFTGRHGVTVHCLKGKLVDIGGILPLMEENP
ncbi:MAG: hypothetical protein BGN88_12925 [Clostridiales bacterium 43-6]|nr:MAG: hypothetical protein BGN88_12925 [Clostridiales bacterium 43-6]